MIMHKQQYPTKCHVPPLHICFWATWQSSSLGEKLIKCHVGTLF